MFSEVDELLQLDEQQHQFVAVMEQPPAEASFLLCHLISRALRAGATVRVLALDKPSSHYRYLCAKCGTDVRQAEADGSLTLVDGAQLTLDALRADGRLSAAAAEAGGPLSARAVYERVTACGDGGLLVLDDLSALVALGCPPADVLLLVHNLRAWSRRRRVRLAALISAAPEDDALCRLAAAVADRADLTVSVRGLSSGHCAEVTGEMDVRVRPGAAAVRRQFKAEDRNVRVFAPGTSRAVL